MFGIFPSSLPRLAIVSGTFLAAFAFKHRHGLHRVDGPSMQPTLNPHLEWNSFFRDVVLTRRIGENELREGRDIARRYKGHIAVIISPKSGNDLLVKRITHSPGETVIPDNLARNKKEVTIPEDHIWVQSDKGRGYADSNVFGPIHVSALRGIVTATVWPPSRVRKLP